MRVDSLTQSLSPQEPITQPWAVRSPVCVAFFSRSSAGSMPSSTASMSSADSKAKWLCGFPKPRKQPVPTVLVQTSCARVWMLPRRYRLSCLWAALSMIPGP